MAGRKIRDEKEARRCLSAAAKSGQQRGEWARDNGIDGRSLNAWRLNIERGGTERSSRDLRLVELVAAVQQPRTQYRVRCGEFVVEVDNLFDGEVLGRLLAVMARC